MKFLIFFILASSSQIENLVEQLEQFREEIINKDEEICQMNMQIEVANREQDSGREDLQGQLDQALEEVHQLEVRWERR